MKILKKIRKLRRDPIAYYLDSKHGFLKRRGERLYAEQTEAFKRIGAANSDKLITVIMTAYNTSHLVEGAIRSVLGQTHSNFELMVIDDASTDDTLDVLKKLAQEDSRVRVFYSPANHGTYWSKNWCLKHARGEFVATHDSDDLSEPLRLQMQLRAMLHDPKRVAVSCRWKRVDEAGTSLVIDGLAERMCAISFMIRREAITQKTGFYDTVRISADTEFITRVTQVFGKEKVHHMRQMLYVGLLRDGSLTTAQGSGFSWQSNDGKSFLRELSGDRADYHKAFHAWHDNNRGNENVLFVQFPLKERTFPAPDGICRNCDDQDLSQVIEVSACEKREQAG